MQPQTFSLTQVSYVTGLTVKRVNKAIENREVPVQRHRAAGKVRRSIAVDGVLCLELLASGLDQLPLNVRKDVFKRVIKQPRAGRLRYSGALIVDLRRARGEVRRRVADIRSAQRRVNADADVMGGMPVIKGTRIPVHMIAEMIKQGATSEEIVEGYPALDAEAVRLAAVYAAIFPRRGRPVAQSWHSMSALKTSRYSLRAA